MDFLHNNCTFRALDENLLSRCTGFDCEHDDLNDFFINDSIKYAQQLFGKSYCFTLDEESDKIVCAFSVSNDSIKARNLQNNTKNRLSRKIHHTKRSHNYPAVLIGRLGVCSEFKKKGVGTELMNFIKGWFVSPENKTGCRFIIVDAYNEEGPINYYKKNDFNFIFNNEEDEKSYQNINSENPLITRLMIFDLKKLSVSPN